MSVFKLNNPKIKDAGNKIGGARKDMYYNYRSFITGLSNAEVLKETTKQKIWGKMDWAALIDSGMPKFNAYMVKYVYDNLASSVAKIYQRVGVLRDYCVKFVQIHLEIKEAILQAAMDADWNIASWFKNFLYEKGYVNSQGILQSTKHPSGFVISDSLIKTLCRGRVDFLISNEICMYAENFPACTKSMFNSFYVDVNYALRSERGAIMRSKHSVPNNGFVLYDIAYVLSSKRRGSTVITVNHMFDINDRKLVVDTLVNSTEFKEFIQSLTTEVSSSKNTVRTKPRKADYIIRPQYAYLERHGPVCRDRDITGDDLINTFKFWGVEYGNWLTGQDRQSTLNYAWEALNDLMYLLNYPKEAVSLSVPSYTCSIITAMGIPTKELNYVLNYVYTKEMRENDKRRGIIISEDMPWSFLICCLREPDSEAVRVVLNWIGLEVKQYTAEELISTVADKFLKEVYVSVGVRCLRQMYSLIATPVEKYVEKLTGESTKGGVVDDCLAKKLTLGVITDDITGEVLDENGVIYEDAIHKATIEGMLDTLKGTVSGCEFMIDCLLRLRCKEHISYSDTLWLEKVNARWFYSFAGSGVGVWNNYSSYLATAYTRPLSLAFGARGVSRAAAHFEPARNVINLTKKNGAGTLAHEWGHAFDYAVGRLMGYLDNDSITAFTKNIFKNGISFKAWSVDSISGTFITGEEYLKLNPELTRGIVSDEMIKLKGCIYDVLFAMIGEYRYGNDADAYKLCVKERIKSAQYIRTRFFKSLSSKFVDKKDMGYFGLNLDACESEEDRNQLLKAYEIVMNLFSDRLEVQDETYRKLIDIRAKGENVYLSNEYISDRLVKCYGETDFTSMKNEVGKRWAFWKTEYYLNAEELDGYAGQPYYHTPAELFARAFESYVYDRMGYDTDYLVHSVTNSSYSVCARYEDSGSVEERSFRVGRGVSPYPSGDERERLNNKIQALVDQVRIVMFGGKCFEDEEKFKEQIAQNNLVDTYSSISQVKTNYLGVKSSENLTPCYTADGELFCFTDNGGNFYNGDLDVMYMEDTAVDTLYSDDGECLYSVDMDVDYGEPETDDDDIYDDVDEEVEEPETDDADIYDDVDEEVEEPMPEDDDYTSEENDEDTDYYDADGDYDQVADADYDDDADNCEGEEFDEAKMKEIVTRAMLYCQLNGYDRDKMQEYYMRLMTEPDCIPSLEELIKQREEADRKAKEEAERLEAERLEAERLEAERLEAERLEAERLEAERKAKAEKLEVEAKASSSSTNIGTNSDNSGHSSNNVTNENGGKSVDALAALRSYFANSPSRKGL